MKRWSLIALVALPVIGVALWFSLLKPSPNRANQTYIPQDTSVRNVNPTTPLSVSNDATPAPVVVTPEASNPPIIDTNSTLYPAGIFNSQIFNTPQGGAHSWAVSFNYSSPASDGSVLVRVIDALSHNPVNFVILSPAPTSGQFSFLEEYYPNPVYVEVTAGEWVLSVYNMTNVPAPSLYSLVNTQTINDLYCVKNKLGQCSYGP